MGCGCQKGKGQQFEVVADGGTGKVLYTSSVKSNAKTVSGRYPGSVVQDKATGANVDAEVEPAAK